VSVEGGMKPSEVFAQRLRETRKARGWTQAELAEQLNQRGIPMNRDALMRIERGARSVSLDEALGLAQCLYAVPALLLTPPEGRHVAIAPNMGLAIADGDEVRDWLTTGVNVLLPRVQGSGAHPALDASFKNTLAILAQALVDAARAGDQAGQRAAVKAIAKAVLDHDAAVAAIKDDDRG
jgi:transcriptional regulator with XRE-family HTH domain